MTLNQTPTRELQAELKRRQRHLDTLQKRRSKLSEELATIDRELAAAGVAPTSGDRRRPRNTQNLADALAALLANRTLSVTEMAQAVQEAGYQTTSPNFRTIVNQTLINDGRFRRVARGRYTAKPVGKKKRGHGRRAQPA